ncbi:DUF402 domain-containing protein [Mycoplasma suis]|uniref:Protein domain associated with RNAses G and E n=2 Tax=Mycoplasma suis TaxID=57372 RepID=F0QRC1_MYCSL|nr:DUF402 domain-containing protein [Mycoplasma suis]ADX98041.1 protein domain associated with RNAses G and E [Mycoplasma suis str. Illinois]CBZ40537.1 conserved hypothetical protein [Mycoplasma suis KI3806]
MVDSSKKFMIHAHKLDHSLCKSIENHYLIYEDSSMWVFFLPPFQTEFLTETEVEIPSRKNKDVNIKVKRYVSSTNNLPIFWFFWKDHWFNVLVTLHPEDKYSIYLNIATPPLVEEKAFKFIDFELDLRLTSEGELNLLNSDIYETQSQRFKYSDNLKKEVSKTMRKIFILLKEGWFQKLVSKENIDSLWNRVTSTLGKEKEELLRKNEGFTELVERLEVSEFN